jgi:tRNA modification GTPase
MVVDGSCELEKGDWEIEALVRGKPALLVINKHDLPSTQNVTIPADFLPATPRIHISALINEGIDALETAIVDLVMGGKVILADTPLVSNPRHKNLLQRALEHTQAAIVAQQEGLSPDLVSIDVREAVEALGEITGETVTEDLLETIFGKFCIGK